ETGVSRSAMISRTTGTNVPRIASSANSSNVVCFMTRELHSSRSIRLDRRRTTEPALELTARLRDEHGHTADDLGARRASVLEQPRAHRVVHEVVDPARTNGASGHDRCVDVRSRT